MKIQSRSGACNELRGPRPLVSKDESASALPDLAQGTLARVLENLGGAEGGGPSPEAVVMANFKCPNLLRLLIFEEKS